MIHFEKIMKNLILFIPYTFSLTLRIDDMSSKQVCTEVPVDRQTVSKYSFVSCTVDSAVARKSLFYHSNIKKS